MRLTKLSTPIWPRGLRHPKLIAALLLLGSGIGLWGASQAGWYPACALAARFSDDGILSDSYVRLIQASQFKLAMSFLLAGGLFSWIDARRVAEILARIPFRWMAAATGLLALGMGYGMQEWLFDGIPHVTDASSHLFQAKIFSLGRLFAPAPECPDAFWQSHVLMTYSGKWFTKYTPGHALLLAAGIRLGLVKWVVPFCAMATIVALGKLLESFADRTSTRLFMAMFLLSPLSLMLSGSYMSHTTAMAFAAGGILVWVQARRQSSRRMAGLLMGLAGFFLAVSAMARPHEFIMIGLIGFLFFLSLGWAEWRRFLLAWPFLLAGAAPVLAFWLHYNATIYGHALAVGYGYTLNGVIRPSSQGVYGFTATYGLKEALSVLVWNFDRVNHSFFGWPISLIFVPFAFSRDHRRWLYLACAGIVVVVGTYFFFGWRVEFENRYYFLCLPFFLYLTVRGMRNLVRCWASPPARAVAWQLVFGLCAAFYLYAALYYWPDYLIPRYRGSYEDSSIEIERTVRARGLENALVLIGPDEGASFVYTSGFAFNDPLLERDVIYARDLPKSIDCLRRAFPGRRFYRYDHAAEGEERLYPLDERPSPKIVARAPGAE